MHVETLEPSKSELFSGRPLEAFSVAFASINFNRNTMLFTLGAIVATPCALRVCTKANLDPMSFIHRHSTGDWGDVGKEDAKANVDALAYDGRIFSVYHIGSQKLYLITEWDRSYTTLMCSEDY